jgi:tripartite-type tricarboxylate transporter receptor subunit TctC
MRTPIYVSTAGMAIALTLALAPTRAIVAAEKYPSKTIQLFSPLPTGGSTDVATRAWMSCVSALAGEPIVLLNRPGANGVIAANVMRQQAADGHSLLLAGMSQMTITPFVFKRPPYNPEEDFVGAAIFSTTSFMLVASKQSGIHSVKELQAYANARPEGVDLGIANIATPAHLLSAALTERLGIRSTLVPQSTEPNGIAALLGGHIPAMIFVSGTAAPMVESGKLVPLMVFTEKRLPEFPEVPTVVEELGARSLVRYGWLGIAAKAGTSKEVTKTVEGWTKTCLDRPDFQHALRSALFTPQFIGSAEYAAVVRADISFWRPWIAKLGITND